MAKQKELARRSRRRCQGCGYKRPEPSVVFVTWPNWAKPRDAHTGQPFYEGAWLCESCRQLDLFESVKMRIMVSREANEEHCRRSREVARAFTRSH